MLAQTAKEEICINQIVGQKTENLTIEGDVIVHDIKPDVLNIISTNGIVCIYKKEVMEGKIRIDGSVNTYIIYFADDEKGSVRSLTTVLDFTQIMDIDNCKPGMTVDENISIKNIECRVINGRKINVKIILEINGRVYSNEKVEIINGINNMEDMQVLNTDERLNSLIGEGNTRVYAKDTIAIDEIDDLAEIMQVKLKILDKQTKTSYNKVLAKADVDVNIMYLTEDNRINTVNTRIPIMRFIDIININEDNVCDAKYKVRNLIIKPNNAEAHSIYVEVEIEISCAAYEMKTINLIEDLYSISSNITFTQKEMTAMSEKQNISEVLNIKDQIVIPEIANKKLYTVKVNAIINNTNIGNGKIKYDGDISLEFLYESNNILDSRTITMPFNFEVMSDKIKPETSIETEIEVLTEDFVVISDSNIQTNLELRFNINICQNKLLHIINEVNVEKIENEEIYSMVIYFVKPGDSLWKIAKKFKSTIGDIARVNKIEDINKINIGQQLYIPKSVNKNIAV